MIEQRTDKIRIVKCLEILDFLAHADELDRNAQLILDGHHDTALGSAVELGQDNSCDIRHFAEQSRLGHGILTGSGIQDEQRLDGTALCLLRQDAVDLLQLVHEVLFVVQTTCGVNDQHITMARHGGGDSIEYDCAGITALGMLDNIHACTLCPNL